MSSKVLFLCDGYGKDNDATGICVRNVAEEFLKRGYEVFCVFNSGKADCEFEKGSIKFYGVKEALYDRLKHCGDSSSLLKRAFFSLFSRIRHIVVAPFYPDVSFVRSRFFYKKALKVVKQERIDVVIASYRPYEAIYSLIRLKKRFSEKLYCVGYHLDLLTAPNTVNKTVRNIQLLKVKKAIDREQRCVDLLVLPSALDNENFRFPNSRFADFPIYNPDVKEIPFDLPYSNDYVNLVYIGSLNSQNRNPQYMVSMLDKMGSVSGKKIVWHIWGKVEQAVLESIKLSEHIAYHGLLNNANVYYALKKSDFIVNISNEQTLNMVPSKIFQSFSAKRPIVNIISSTEDVSIPYFERYGDSLNVYKHQDEDANVQKIKEFLENKLSQEIKGNEDLLRKCTPAFFVDTFEDFRRR